MVTALKPYWGYVLLLLQVLNALAVGVTYLSGAVSEAHKPRVMAIGAAIALAVGAIQSITKALPDGDGDGVPDLFETSTTPVPPTPPSTGVGE